MTRLPLAHVSDLLNEVSLAFPKLLNDSHVLCRSKDMSFCDALKKPTVAIVGTRHPTPYGERSCRRIIGELSRYDVNVVSGGAMGVDRIVHEECLKRGVSNQAWVVGPVASPSPQSQSRVFSALEARTGCAVLTPEILEPQKGDRVLKYFWILRNYWLVACAKYLIVIEALEKSGTWSTLEAALTFGVETFSLPGPIDSPQSVGTNAMITRGCARAFEMKDFLTNSLLVPRPGNSYNLVKRRGGPIGPETATGVAQTTQMTEVVADKIDAKVLVGSDEGAKQLDKVLTEEGWGWGAGKAFRKE